MIKRKSSTGTAAPARGAASPVEWEDAARTLTRRCVFMQAYGDTGTGRTSLALSAPGPIALLHASEKIEGIVQRFAKDKEIRMYDFGGVYTGTSQQIADKANRVMAGFKAAIEDAFGWARTIVIDTHTEAWELLRLARFGTLTPKGNSIAFLYAPVNAEWRSIFKQFHQQKTTNLIAIGQMKELYRNDKATGRMVQAGQKEMSYYADVVVRTDKDGGTFSATIEKGWWNAATEGLSVEDEMATFPQIMSLVTETDEEDWS